MIAAEEIQDHQAHCQPDLLALEAVAAAQEDDAARLRHYLRRFEAVT